MMRRRTLYTIYNIYCIYYIYKREEACVLDDTTEQNDEAPSLACIAARVGLRKVQGGQWED